MLHKGETFDISREYRDTATGRPGRQLTAGGMYNIKSPYHYGTCFTADSRRVVYAGSRDGASALFAADVTTGKTTVLAVTDGTGAPGQLHAEGSAGEGYFERFALCPASGWVAARLGRSLVAVHVDTLEERVLMADLDPAKQLSAPDWSADGSILAVTTPPEHPDRAAGLQRNLRPLFQALVEEFGGAPTDYLQIDFADGSVRTVHHEPLAGSNHVQICPTDPDLWLIDRDLPPGFNHYGDDRQTSRAWLLRVSTGEMTELRPRCRWRFAMHTNWSADGERIYHHERSPGDGQAIGVIDREGNVLWEYEVPEFMYGHVGTHPRRECVIVDGTVSNDLICALDYSQAGSDGPPRIEVLARHGTQWRSAPGQLSHPHPSISPDGRWVCYNASRGCNSDVYVTRISD